MIIDSSSVVNWTIIVWIHVHNKPGEKIECFLEYRLDHSQFFQNSWGNTEAWHFVMDYKKKIIYRLPTKKNHSNFFLSFYTEKEIYNSEIPVNKMPCIQKCFAEPRKSQQYKSHMIKKNNNSIVKWKIFFHSWSIN